MKTICKFSKNTLLKSKKSKQRIVKGYIWGSFIGYYLEGLLISHAKFYEKVSNE